MAYVKSTIILGADPFNFPFQNNSKNLHRFNKMDLIQSNLGYPNADYPKLLGFSKSMDSPDFFLYYLLQLPIIRISIIRKIQFFEVIRRSRLKKLLLKYPLRFEVQKSHMVIMISLFGRVRFTHLSDLANKVTPD